VIPQERHEHGRDGNHAHRVAGPVLELALVDGCAVVGPCGAYAFRGPGQDQPAPALCWQLTAVDGEGGGLGRAQEGVVEAGEERDEFGAFFRDGGQQVIDLPGAGDDAAVNLVRGLRGLPGHLVDRVGGQDVELNRVAEHAVEDRSLAGDHRGRGGFAVHGQGDGVERAADEFGAAVLLIKGDDFEGIRANPGDRGSRVLVGFLGAAPFLVEGPAIERGAQDLLLGHAPGCRDQDRRERGQRVSY